MIGFFSLRGLYSSISEVVVAFLILLIILVDALIVFLVSDVLFVTLLALVFWLKTALLLVTALRTEPSFCLPHLVELRVCAPMTILVILKNLILLVLRVLILQLVNNCLSLLLALSVFQVVHIKLMLEVVNVGILFNIHAVEPFKLAL